MPGPGNPEKLNRGGNEGNKYGAGRKRSVIRAKFTELTDSKTIPFLVSIMDGTATATAYTKDGKAYERGPTMADKRWAADMLAKYGLPTMSLDNEDDESGGKRILVIDL